MRLETSIQSIATHVEALNQRFENKRAEDVMRFCLTAPQFGQTALVSSFGAESVVLLHMLSEIDKSAPVIFIDTRMLFRETLAYQTEVAALLGLTGVRHIQPDLVATLLRDSENLLHRADTDACCALRKTEPLHKALVPFNAWISGRKRFQGNARSNLTYFENENDQRIKINPLAHWSRAEVSAYIDAHSLPRHPLVAKGFKSIGCAPCTTKVERFEDDRAGRWRDQSKVECGIHFSQSGKAERANAEAASVIVSDAGFAADDWQGGFLSLEGATGPAGADATVLAVDLPNTAEAQALLPRLHEIDMIRIDFPSFADGRGFSLAQQLRALGFDGRLRAKGHVISDQYAMARRSGFDEVEIDQALARRQPQEQWQFRRDWRQHDYRQQLFQPA